LHCGLTDERRSTGVEWALRDVVARIGVCSRCFATDQQPKLRERFVRESEKARNCTSTI
jgi:hypothetical protein